MYNDPQNETTISLYQTKQRTLETQVLVCQLIDTLSTKSTIPEIVASAMLDWGFDIYGSDEITSLVLDMKNNKAVTVVKKCLTHHVEYMFDELFFWNDEVMGYSSKLDLYK